MSDYIDDIHAELGYSKTEGPDVAARIAVGLLQATGKVSKLIIHEHEKDKLKGSMLFLDTGPVYGKEEGLPRILDFICEAIGEIYQVKKEE